MDDDSKDIWRAAGASLRDFADWVEEILDDPVPVDPPADEPAPDEPPVVVVTPPPLPPMRPDGWRERIMPSSNPVILGRGQTYGGFTVQAGQTVMAEPSDDASLPLPVITPGPSGDCLRMAAGSRAFDIECQGGGRCVDIRGDDVYLEGVVMDGGNYGMGAESCKNAHLYRCIIDNSKSVAGWLNGTTDLTVEQCLINRVIERHGFYCSGNTGLTFTDSMFVDVPMIALKLRGFVNGADILRNCFLRCGDTIQGGNEGSGAGNPGGNLTNITIVGNLFDRCRGNWLIDLFDVFDSAINNNLFVDSAIKPYNGAVNTTAKGQPATQMSCGLFVVGNRFLGAMPADCVRLHKVDGATVNRNVLRGAKQGLVLQLSENVTEWDNETGPEVPVPADIWRPSDDYIAEMGNRRYPEPWPTPWVTG